MGEFPCTGPVSDPSELKERRDSEPDDRLIEFACKEEYYGEIPEPIPANKDIPDWFEDLDPRMDNTNNQNKGTATVKLCAPFLDALSLGWLLPMVADIEFNQEGSNLTYNNKSDNKAVSSHYIEQVGGENFDHSENILKFSNYWCMKVPEGYSVLITSPLNRVNPLFEPFTGVVDCDKYYNFIHIPVMWTANECEGVIEKGTPIAQVIPIKREAMISDGTVRPMTDDESETRDRTKQALSRNPSLYREELWVPKRTSRIISEEELE